MNIPHFLRRLFLISLAGWLGLASALAAKQPNILFIFSDDHAYQAVSAYNDPRKLNQTPNIDRIAKEGMLFRRAMVPNSICGPSRATVLTGKYSHANGFYNNTNSRFDGSQQTMPKLLQAAGYQTAMIGKWHLVSDPTGFDYWEILPGQGRYYNPPMNRMGQQIARTGYATDIITDLALDWLKQRDKSKPFLMMCQHKAPHREWSPNLKNLGWNGDRKFAEPETLFDDYAGRGKAEHSQDMMIAKTFTPLDVKLNPPPGINEEQLAKWNEYYGPRNAAFTNANLSGKELTQWRYQRYMHDYLGCIASVDESVGRLLKFLDDEGLAKDTIVIYSSDQGFYLGEHGWFDKRWIFEESLRTPLVARWPGVTKPGSESRDIVSNVDFAETFLEAAGAPVPADMQGRSLVPVLRGTGSLPVAGLYAETYLPRIHFNWSELRSIHFGRYHFIDAPKAELFDLSTDPRETKNLYSERRAAANELRKRLTQL
ncbi:MAG: sulfatase, partial [Verrucomicrobia bacterium]|nr:sulfatase [Verrucomicrobiota bacterium]